MRRTPKPWVTLAVSALAHGAIAGVAIGHGFAAAPRGAKAPTFVELSLEPTALPPDPLPLDPPSALRSTATSHAPAPHHHSYPVPFDHDAHPHDPNLVHAPVPVAAEAETPMPAASETEVAPTATRPVFVLAGNSALSTHGGDALVSAGTAAAEVVPVYGEREVSTRARLLGSATANYPAAARRAGVEADVPVEIVVDETGRVIGAHALSRAPYGLDEAAVTAVRGYSFSPARRDGTPVRMRLHWVVRFHLD